MRLGQHPGAADRPLEQLRGVARIDDLHARELEALALPVMLDGDGAVIVHRDDAHHARLERHRERERENEGNEFHLRSCGAEGMAIARPQDADSGVEGRRIAQGGMPPATGARMPVRIRTSGCLFSIIASLLLTLLLNLALRACQ